VTTQREADATLRPAGAGRPSGGSGIAIAVIAGAQLMVALDVTIVNIALPHVQAALHFSGLAFLPLMVLLGATAQAGGRLITRIEPKPLLIFGATAVLAALLWLSRISEGSTYVGRVLPALLILGVGVGAFFVPLAGTASTSAPARSTPPTSTDTSTGARS
jgi:MFS family permease